MDCTVRTLALGGPAAQRGRARAAIEAVLHGAIPDDRRLWLVRRMTVTPRTPHRPGTLPGATRPGAVVPEAAVRAGWLAATGDARHGASDGSADANCVWFASRAEAAAVLLRRLLAGQSVDAWFWRLAVPGWHGQGLRPWLAASLRAALDAADGAMLVALVDAASDAAGLDLLIAVLGEAPPTAAAESGLIGGGASSWNDLATRREHAAAAAMAVSAAAPPAPLPPTLARLVAAIIAVRGADAVARPLVRQWLLRRSPALALAPALLDTAVLAALRDPFPTAASSVKPDRPAAVATAARAAQQRLPTRALAAGAALRAPGRCEPGRAADRPARRRPAAAAQAATATDRPPPVADVAPAEIMLSQPVASRHAGLWLTVPALADLGYAAWLAARPALLGDDPGRAVMHALARHHRIAPDDPALLPLGLPAADPAPSWALLWCRALDGWYRRAARRRVHDLLRRPGRLLLVEDRLEVHYPAADADIALRRLAVDRDPGWTPWLGLSIRFHFDGERLAP